MAKTIEVFKNLPDMQEPAAEMQQDPSKLGTLQVGFGGRVLRVDRSGIWLGAEKFEDAPFTVDMEGNATINSITLSGYIPTGGALSDIGAGNITGTYISSGAITTPKLSATAIDGMTITGATVRTASSGSRVVMDGSGNRLRIYSGSTERMRLEEDELIFYDSSGNERGGIYASSTTSLYFHALNGGNIIIEAEGSLYGVLMYANGSQVAAFTTAGLGMDDDVTMNGNDINMNSGDILTLRRIEFVSSSTNPSQDGQMRYYVNGGTEGLRMQFGGSDFQFDASGV